MANKKLSAVITIGGAVASSLGSAFGSIRRQTDGLGKAVGDLTRRQKLLGESIQTFGRTGHNVDKLRTKYEAVTAELDKQRTRLRELASLQRNISAHRDTAGRAQSDFFGRAASAVAIGAIARTPLKDFEELDAAMNNMEVAFMTSGGGVPKQLEQIKRQTVELGNLLPGTTADFVNLASALKEQGTSSDSIVGGALKSAAHLSVIMKMVPEQAGEMVAKLREAFALSDNEFSQMADYTQRARFGFGLKSEDMLLGAKYYGGKLNTLGITGADNVRKVYALQGMAAQQGMDGSTFGTNFGQMLTRLGTMTDRLNKSSKEMQHVNAMLKESGIELSFFGKDGKFSGVDNMVAQLGKLGRLTQEKRLQVLFRLFGEEGSRPADLIARTGVEGFQKALATMDNEASLDQRIGKSVTSFRNRLEALGGTLTNLMAAIGEPLAQMLDPVIESLNEITGGPLQDWVKENGLVIKSIAVIGAGVAAFLAIGAAISAVTFVTSTAVAGFLALAPAVTVAGTALRFAGTAAMWLGRALFMNPIGLAIGAIAGAAFLIYKYWDPLKAFFSELWDGIKATFAGVYDWIMAKVQMLMELPGRIKDRVAGVFERAGSALGTAAYDLVHPGDVPALPAIQKPGGAVTDNSQHTYHIQVPSGTDTKALADEIERRRRQQEGVRARSRMVDGAGAQ